MLKPPVVHIVPKIFCQCLWCGKNIWDFLLAYMLMIALACFVIVAEHTISFHNQGEPILETVMAIRDRLGQRPHYHFNEGIIGEDVALVQH